MTQTQRYVQTCIIIHYVHSITISVLHTQWDKIGFQGKVWTHISQFLSHFSMNPNIILLMYTLYGDTKNGVV